MREILKNEILAALATSNETGWLDYKLSEILSRYDITAVSKDLTAYSYELPVCYKAFMVTKRIEGASVKTLDLYKRYIEQMLTDIAKPVESITKNDMMVYMYHLQQQRQLSNHSLESRRSVYSSFFGWITGEGYVDRNPMITIRPIKYEETERKPLTADQMEQIRQACQNARDKAMVEVLYSTACRVSELANLNVADVNFSTGEVILFGKGSKHRKSYLSARAKLYLQTYLAERDDECEALFVTDRAPHCRFGKSGIERRVRLLGEATGIKLHPHLFRHTSATDALNHGMDITQVQQILGHADINTTLIYAKVSNDDVARNHQKFVH